MRDRQEDRDGVVGLRGQPLLSGAVLACAGATGIIARLSVRSEGDSGSTGNNAFAANTVTVDQGSGSYTYQWVVVANDGSSAWSITNDTTATGTPSVALVPSLTTATATIACDVTDTATGATTRSELAFYSYQRTT